MDEQKYRVKISYRDYTSPPTKLNVVVTEQEGGGSNLTVELPKSASCWSDCIHGDQLAILEDDGNGCTLHLRNEDGAGYQTMHLRYSQVEHLSALIATINIRENIKTSVREKGNV